MFKDLEDLDTKVPKNDILTTMLVNLANSTPTAPFDIMDPNTGEVYATVYTPEDKLMAQELLKIYGGFNSSQQEYDAWHAEMLKAAKKYNLTKEELSSLLDTLSQRGI